MKTRITLSEGVAAGEYEVEITPAAPPVPPAEEIHWGMNLDGLQFGEKVIHGVYGQNYFSPTAAEMDYFKGKGMIYHRLGFRWERVQHTPYDNLDPQDLGYIDKVLSAATARGLQIYICPWNYGRYKVASTQTVHILKVPEFADLWDKLARYFKGRVWAYDLMNEPHDMGSSTLWRDAAQAAINAIRAVDSSTPIIVGGDHWSSSVMWPAASDNLKNLTDPAGKLIYAGHCYFDFDTSGTHFEDDPDLDPTPATRGKSLLEPFMKWLRANGKTGAITEMGWPGSDFWCNTVARPALDYIQACRDVIKYVGIHTCGPAWGSYAQSLEPTKDSSGKYVDKPQMNLLEPYIKG